MDKDVAKRVLRELQVSGLRMWIDEHDLEPGTPDWEKAIRDAVSSAFAIVLVCTPNIPASPFVQAEIKLASGQSLPIYPIWVNGDSWVDCAPLSLVNYQYVDCRVDRFLPGLSELAQKLRQLISARLPKLLVVDALEDVPSGFVSILMPKKGQSGLDLNMAGHIVDHELRFEKRLREDLQVVATNPDSYASFEELLDDIYTRYLRVRYEPYTYGKNWVLPKPSVYVSLLALPWEWLRHKRGRLLIDAIPHYLERATPLQKYGFRSGAHWRTVVWAIVETGFEPASGLFTSDQRAVDQAFDSLTKSLAFTLDRCKHATGTAISGKLPTGVYKLDELDPEHYSYKLVVVEHMAFDKWDMSDSAFVITDMPRI
jgi:hypothetical protein